MQPSAYFINIIKENYALKPKLLGVLIFLATRGHKYHEEESTVGEIEMEAWEKVACS